MKRLTKVGVSFIAAGVMMATAPYAMAESHMHEHMHYHHHKMHHHKHHHHMHHAGMQMHDMEMYLRHMAHSMFKGHLVGHDGMKHRMSMVFYGYHYMYPKHAHKVHGVVHGHWTVHGLEGVGSVMSGKLRAYMGHDGMMVIKMYHHSKMHHRHVLELMVKVPVGMECCHGYDKMYIAAGEGLHHRASVGTLDHPMMHRMSAMVKSIDLERVHHKMHHHKKHHHKMHH